MAFTDCYSYKMKHMKSFSCLCTCGRKVWGAGKKVAHTANEKTEKDSIQKSNEEIELELLSWH